MEKSHMEKSPPFPFVDKNPLLFLGSVVKIPTTFFFFLLRRVLNQSVSEPW